MKTRFILLCALLLAASFPTEAAEVESLVPLCEDCHGMAGASGHEDVPSIGGQSKTYMVDNLLSFQVWGRPCVKSKFRYGDTSRPRTDMCQIAGGLSAEDIETITTHFADLPFVPAKQPFDAEKAGLGAAVHAEKCESCHPRGGSEPGIGPRLAGQWVTYLRSSLKFVPTGEHLVPPLMEEAVADMGPIELDQLMHFYASQQE
jgi:sulfide dehydrogenase cytochrome subunit